jgi:hypothetical protein
MGFQYVVHRANPAAIARVLEAFRGTPDLDWAGARLLFEQLGRRRPPDTVAESWEDCEEQFETGGWNLVLAVGASEASWDLDKSLDRPGDGLPGVAELLPELAPVKAVLTALESLHAAELPKAFQPPEFGLMGIAPPDTVKAALPVAERYSRPDTRGLIGSVSLPWLKRASGGAATLSSWRGNDYLWDHWLRLMAAIREAASRNHALALGMR